MNKILILCFLSTFLSTQNVFSQEESSSFASLRVLINYSRIFQAHPFFGKSFRIFLKDTNRVKEKINLLQSCPVDTFPVVCLMVDSSVGYDPVKKFLDTVQSATVGILAKDSLVFLSQKEKHSFVFVSDTGISNFKKKILSFTYTNHDIDRTLTPLITLVDLQLEFAYLLELQREKKTKEKIYLVVPAELTLYVEWVATSLHADIVKHYGYGN